MNRPTERDFEELGIKVREGVPLSSLNTMRLGGNARYVAQATTADEIKKLIKLAKEFTLPYWIMGGGANTIGKDGGFNGIIILNQLHGIFVHENDELLPVKKLDQDPRTQPEAEELTVTAMAGEIWDDLVNFACELGYSGIEAMSKVPGTVGAAPVQNIGAYGQDVAAVIEEAKVYDTKNDVFTSLSQPEMQMSYRHTRFNYGEDKDRFVVLSITLKLQRREMQPPFYNSLQRYIDANHETDFSPKNIRKMVSTIRGEKLPDPQEIASSGSFFKNVYLSKERADEAEAKGIPVWRNTDGSGKINSGWLIEQCGFKGKELYGFKVSEKAALVLINERATSYVDLEKARKEIVEAVDKKFGYALQQEPVEIGE